MNCFFHDAQHEPHGRPDYVEVVLSSEPIRLPLCADCQARWARFSVTVLRSPVVEHPVIGTGLYSDRRADDRDTRETTAP